MMVRVAGQPVPNYRMLVRIPPMVRTGRSWTSRNGETEEGEQYEEYDGEQQQVGEWGRNPIRSKLKPGGGYG